MDRNEKEPPENDWHIPAEPEGEPLKFDIEETYPATEFLRILRTQISAALLSSVDGRARFLNALELWEMRVLELTGGHDGDPDDFVIGFNLDQDNVARIHIIFKG